MSYYKKNINKIKSYTRDYYVANREIILSKSKDYREKNKDKIKEQKDYYKESLYNHLFYEANHERLRLKANENGRKYYKKKKDLNVSHIPKKPRVYEPIEPKIKIEPIKPIHIRFYPEGVNPFL